MPVDDDQDSDEQGTDEPMAEEQRFLASLSLAEALALRASDLAPLEHASAPDTAVTYSRAGRPFAVIEPGGLSASFLLSPAVGDAALRTPDTTPSARGPGWVTLRPALVDGHALDRTTAWFESAWRHAGE